MSRAIQNAETSTIASIESTEVKVLSSTRQLAKSLIYVLVSQGIELSIYTLVFAEPSMEVSSYNPEITYAADVSPSASSQDQKFWGIRKRGTWKYFTVQGETIE